MAVEWRHEGFTAAAAYRLEITGGGSVKLDDGQGCRRTLGARLLPHELYWCGGWMAESVRGDAYIEVWLSCLLPAERPLRITFETGIAGQVVISLLQTPPESRTFLNVASITVAANQTVCLECEGTSPLPVWEPVSDTVFRSTQRQELEKAREDLAEARAGLEMERQTTLRLQDLLTVRGDELITELAQERARLSEVLEEKLAQAEAAQQELEELQARLEEAKTRDKTLEQELASLQTQLEEAEGQNELKTLDCEQARTNLHCLQAQLADDKDTLTLMEEEPFLTGNSVRKTLEDTEKKLEAVERRIGRIIALREGINDTVQRAITRGDGILPLSGELGGDQDGPGEHEEADTPAGGAASAPEP